MAFGIPGVLRWQTACGSARLSGYDDLTVPGVVHVLCTGYFDLLGWRLAATEVLPHIAGALVVVFYVDGALIPMESLPFAKNMPLNVPHPARVYVVAPSQRRLFNDFADQCALVGGINCLVYRAQDRAWALQAARNLARLRIQSPLLPFG